MAREIDDIVQTELSQWFLSFEQSKQTLAVAGTEDEPFSPDTPITPVTARTFAKAKNEIEVALSLVFYNPELHSAILDLNGSLFEIEVLEPYAVSGDTKNNFIIKTSDLKLGQLVEKLTCFVEKDHISWTSPCINISMVLSRAVNYFVLLQHKEVMGTYQEVDHGIELPFSPTQQQYMNPWSNEASPFSPASVDTKLYLLKQIQACQKAATECNFEFDLVDDNPSLWQVTLCQFDFVLGEDLKQYEEKFKIGNKGITLEIKFPSEFPARPPMVRIVRPRLQYLTGQVSFGGIMCLDFLTAQHWNPKITMESVIAQLRSALMDHAARVDMRTPNDYNEAIAVRSMIRLTKAENLPTANSFSCKLNVFSTTFATSFLDIQIPHNLELGNKVLMPRSVAEELFTRDFELPLIFELRGRHSHVYCGVLEFTSCENSVIVPMWLFASLQVTQGAEIATRCVKLEQGSKVKLQPHSKSFYKIKDHQSVLEEALFQFAALTEGQSIPITYEDEIHMVEIVECKPLGAISVMADSGFLELAVEFEPAVDLVDENELNKRQNAVEMKKLEQQKKEMEEIITYIQMQRGEKKAKLNPEPNAGSDVALVRFRFPNGKSVDRRFSREDSVEQLYYFVESSLNPSLWVPRVDCCIELRTFFPSIQIPYPSPDITIERMDLHPKGAVAVVEREVNKETML